MIEKPFQEIVAAFAAKTPTPGGGAAAAMTAAVGVALFQMVVRFARAKKQNVDREPDLAEAEATIETWLARALPMADRDCASFDLVSRAYALAKDSDEQRSLRTRAIEEAMIGAMVVPEELLHLVRDVLAAMAKVHQCIAKAIASDLGVGAELLRAAGEGALLNVRINAGYLQDKHRAQTALTRTFAVRKELQRDYEVLRAFVEKQMA